MTVYDLQWRPLEPWWRSLLQHQSNNNGQMRCDTCDCAIEVVKIYFLPNSRPHSTAAYLANLGLPTNLQAFFPKFNLSMIQFGFPTSCENRVWVDSRPRATFMSWILRQSWTAIDNGLRPVAAMRASQGHCSSLRRAGQWHRSGNKAAVEIICSWWKTSRQEDN